MNGATGLVVGRCRRLRRDPHQIHDAVRSRNGCRLLAFAVIGRQYQQGAGARSKTSSRLRSFRAGVGPRERSGVLEFERLEQEDRHRRLFGAQAAPTTRSSKAFQKTAAGKDVKFSVVLRAERHAEQGRGQRPARRLRGFLPRARPHPSGAQAGGHSLERRRHQGHGVRLGRRDRGPQGQPEAHHRLGRPDQVRHQDRHAGPGSRPARPSGTSWPPTSTSSPPVAARPTPRPT